MENQKLALKYETEQTEEWKSLLIALIKLNKANRKKVSQREGFSPVRNLNDFYERRQAIQK